MSTREQLAEVIRDGVDTWRTPLEAADAILAALAPQRAALDAVLALADNLDAEAVGAEIVRIELMKEPRTNGMRQQIYAYAQTAASSRSGAYRIRNAVNDALEAGK